MRPFARSVTVRVECGRSSTCSSEKPSSDGHLGDRAVGQGARGVAGPTHQVLGGRPRSRAGSCCARASRAAGPVVARRASSGVAMAASSRRASSRCSPTSASRTSVGRLRVGRTLGSPSAAYATAPCARSSSISSAARRDGGAASSRSVVVVPSAVARACSRLSRGSRRPFSTSESWLAVEPTWRPSSSSVRPRSVRACRIRRPSSSSCATGFGGPARVAGQVDDRSGCLRRHGVDGRARSALLARLCPIECRAQ